MNHPAMNFLLCNRSVCRRTIVALMFLVALTALLLVSASVRADQPNIVLFVADDLGPDAGCYGVDSIRTPNIDALAADGLRMERAFCTTASCSASRSVILTGIFNHANAHYGHQHAYHHFSSYDEIQSLPVRLAKAGYRTTRIGKYHVAPESVFKFDQALPGNARNGVQMANNAAEFLTAKDDRPFFLYFCTTDPHRGGGTVAGDPHKANAFGNKLQGYPGVKKVAYAPADVKVPRFLPDTPTCRHELAQYYQSVSRVDQGLGRLVKILKANGQYENTVIIFTSDHGIAFPGGKTTLYEGGMQVPMIVRTPKMAQRGAASDAMVSLVDLTPTILDLAEALDANKPKPRDRFAIQGTSFASLLTDMPAENATPPREEVYASHTFHEVTMYYPMRVVRTGRYKLIWNIAHGLPYPFASDLWAAPTWQDVYQQGPDAYYGKRSVRDYIHRSQFELYDLETDPDEVNNLAKQPEHAGRLESLKQKLKAFQERTDDPWISKWDYE